MSSDDADPNAISRTGVLTPTLVAGFIAVVAVLIAARVAGTVNLRGVYDTSGAVAHTYSVDADLQRILTTLVDAETGERGFIITGEASYLEPYERARGEVASQIAHARALIADREQQSDLDRISTLTDTRLAELARAIRLRQESGLAAAQAVIVTNVGKQTMDELRAIVARMEAREDARLTVRTAQAAQSYRLAYLLGFGTTGLALVVVIVLFVGAWRAGTERLLSVEVAERFRVTLASIGDAMMATDANGGVSFMNHVAERLTGWKQEDAAGKPLEDVFRIVNEETRDKVENPALRAMRDGVIVGLANHTVLIGKDGAETPIDDIGSPLKDADGKILGSVLIFRDITERRKVDRERALQAEQARMLDSGFDAIIVRDDQDRIRSWNRVAEEMYGWAGDEALGQATHTLFNTVFPKPLAEITAELHQRNRWQGELVHTRKDGRRMTVLSHWILDRDSQNQARSILEINVDISPLKRAEEMLREQRRSESEARVEAETAELRLQMALEAGHMGTWHYAVRTGKVVWSPGLEQIHGYEPGTFPGTLEAFRDEIHPDDRDRVLRAINEASTGRQSHEIEYRIIRRDGRVRWVEGRGRLFLDDEGDPDRMLGVCADITERKLAEEVERKSRRAAEEANRTKDEFLAMVSHELRNPLNAILGWAVILKTGHVPFERANHAFDVIERNARVEAQLVESLLDFSRIAAGQLKLESERVDLEGVVRNVVDSLRPAADAKDLTLGVAVQPVPMVIIGDSARLQQILSNLLMNAIKFTASGGHVRVELNRAGSQVEIRVIDDGEGIDGDFLPYIFDRFRQADTAKDRVHGGLGLGLAIVRELVHAHGGNVVAQSPGKGQGSVFTVALPIPAVIPAYIEAATLQIPLGDEPSVEGLLVLVVDDDADARDLVSVTLESQGALVQLASSVAEALGSIDRKRPDAMIADIGMPEKDGYELIRRLRAEEREHSMARLPAIALTAYASAADREQALAAGFDVHLAKPIGPRDLTQALAKFRKPRGRQV